MASTKNYSPAHQSIKNSRAVIDWFKDLTEKNRCTFLQFDIENFYPSISVELFNNAIDFAKQHVAISDSDLAIIAQARRTILFHNNEPWIKQSRDEDFDVPMGSFDGAEVCELVGTYMLSQITTVIRSSDIGLYRDDGLGVMKRLGKPEIERKKKRIIQIFKDNGLKVIVQAHLRSA